MFVLKRLTLAVEEGFPVAEMVEYLPALKETWV